MVTGYSDNGECHHVHHSLETPTHLELSVCYSFFIFMFFFCTNEYLELLLVPMDGVAGVAGEGGDDRGVNGGSRCFTTRLEPQVEYFI